LTPAAALADTVPVALPLVRVRSVVSELFHVTDVVMSSWVLLPEKVANALKVTDELGAGLVGVAVSVIWVGAPWLTVTVTLDEVMVPRGALMAVVQIPVTEETGVASPELLIVAQLVVPELQETLPVTSLVELSL